MSDESKKFTEILDVVWDSKGAKIIHPHRSGNGTDDMIVANDAKEFVNSWKGKKGWLQIKWMEKKAGGKWPLAIAFQEGEAPPPTAGQAAPRQGGNIEQMLSRIDARLDRIEGMLSERAPSRPNSNSGSQPDPAWDPDIPF